MFNVTRFLNVSAVVRDLDRALQNYEDLFGLTCAYRVAVPEMACDSAILPLGGGVSYSLELVQPMDTTGHSAKDGASYSPQQAEAILRRFLGQRGEGIYRLAFEVEDFDEAVAHLRSRGADFTYYDLDLPDGASKVVIVHPRQTGGIMFEFLPLGAYEPGANFGAWPKGQTGIFRRLLNTSCAVPDLDATLRSWRYMFGLEANRIEIVPEMAVRTAILRIQGEDVLEAFEPMADDLKDKALRYNPAAQAQLKRFLARRGGSVYRLALEVKDYDSTLADFDRRGLSYVPFRLELAGGPLRVTVLHPKHTNGVMFELCEPGNAAFETATVDQVFQQAQ